MAHEKIDVAGETVHTGHRARQRLKKRYAAETRFKLYGVAALLVSGVFLVALLGSIISKGLPAFTYNYVTVSVDLSSNNVNPDKPQAASYNGILRSSLKQSLPFVSTRKDRKILNSLLSSGAGILLQREVIAQKVQLGAESSVALPLSDYADLYLKGLITKKSSVDPDSAASVSITSSTASVHMAGNVLGPVRDEITAYLNGQAEDLRRRIALRRQSEKNLLSKIYGLSGRITQSDPLERKRLEEELSAAKSSQERVQDIISALQVDLSRIDQRLSKLNGPQQLNDEMPSYFINIAGGVLKVDEIDGNQASGPVLIPIQNSVTAQAGNWSLEKIEVPQSSRKFSDREIAYTDYLEQKGQISNRWNSIFLTAGASREPEMAGIWGAVVGTFWTMIVTLSLSFPVGVASAIYLEEFAPKNRWTQFIEVNINNLAAVPSIVFGLLGLAVFLNVFGLPRSAPVVGGMVLALMTLPTIIIASRAALQAVPPSIREAALGVGASRLQAVFHHVLPLAMPGILTGTIIGMAQALGETAPLLMIGMVAFIVDVPGTPLDPSTVLPVQIFMWADFPEPAFQQKTSAAIMVLLGFLICMNAIAIVLRKKFERRW
nr:phosphate ABC transporter permease PstA [Pseudovibrio sp. M1P-2-3]